MANCCHIFVAVLALKVAFLVGLYFNQLVPDGLPDDHLPSVRLYGFSWNTAYVMVGAGIPMTSKCGKNISDTLA